MYVGSHYSQAYFLLFDLIFRKLGPKVRNEAGDEGDSVFIAAAKASAP